MVAASAMAGAEWAAAAVAAAMEEARVGGIPEGRAAAPAPAPNFNVDLRLFIPSAVLTPGAAVIPDSRFFPPFPAAESCRAAAGAEAVDFRFLDAAATCHSPPATTLSAPSTHTSHSAPSSPCPPPRSHHSPSQMRACFVLPPRNDEGSVLQEGSGASCAPAASTTCAASATPPAASVSCAGAPFRSPAPTQPPPATPGRPDATVVAPHCPDETVAAQRRALGPSAPALFADQRPGAPPPGIRGGAAGAVRRDGW